MKNKRVLILIFIAVIGIIVFRLASGPKRVQVKEVKLENRVVKRTVNSSGVVKAKNQADLGFASLGRVQILNTTKGDTVQKGAYLASLDAYSESETAKAFKDERDIALKERELFIVQYETDMEEVGGPDEYEILLNEHNEKVSQAQAYYNSQLGDIGTKYLYAPFAGTIVDTYKEVGETASPGETILKLADLENLVFEITLDQEDFGLLKNGQEVEIVLDSYDEEIFSGRVSELPTYIDTTSGSDFIVEIEFTGESKNKALLGMAGDANIVLATSAGEVPTLVYDELFYDIDNEPYVFVLKDGKAVKQHIDTGLEGDIYYEIKDAISDPIIVSLTAEELEEGKQVVLK